MKQLVIEIVVKSLIRQREELIQSLTRIDWCSTMAGAQEISFKNAIDKIDMEINNNVSFLNYEILKNPKK